MHNLSKCSEQKIFPGPAYVRLEIERWDLPLRRYNCSGLSWLAAENRIYHLQDISMSILEREQRRNLLAIEVPHLRCPQVKVLIMIWTRPHRRICGILQPSKCRGVPDFDFSTPSVKKIILPIFFMILQKGVRTITIFKRVGESISACEQLRKGKS